MIMKEVTMIAMRILALVFCLCAWGFRERGIRAE